MHQVLRLSVAALAVVTLAWVSGTASAQAPGPAPIKQVKLSEKQVEGFIAAHKEVVETWDKMQSDKAAESAVKAQLDKIAKKFGFKDHAEYDIVVTNVEMVMYGLDPQTKTFTEPTEVAKKELEAALADKNLSEKERKRVQEDFTLQLKMMRPIENAGNIELVKKYYDQIEPLLK
jgi:hypothetical protein